MNESEYEAGYNGGMYFINVEQLGVRLAVGKSAGSDGATIVFVDTRFEPDASDDGPGLRVLVNDGDAYVGVPFAPSDDV